MFLLKLLLLLSLNERTATNSELTEKRLTQKSKEAQNAASIAKKQEEQIQSNASEAKNYINRHQRLSKKQAYQPKPYNTVNINKKTMNAQQYMSNVRAKANEARRIANNKAARKQANNNKATRNAVLKNIKKAAGKPRTVQRNIRKGSKKREERFRTSTPEPNKTHQSPEIQIPRIHPTIKHQPTAPQRHNTPPAPNTLPKPPKAPATPITPTTTTTPTTTKQSTTINQAAATQSNNTSAAKREAAAKEAQHKEQKNTFFGKNLNTNEPLIFNEAVTARIQPAIPLPFKPKVTPPPTNIHKKKGPVSRTANADRPAKPANTSKPTPPPIHLPTQTYTSDYSNVLYTPTPNSGNQTHIKRNLNNQQGYLTIRENDDAIYVDRPSSISSSKSELGISINKLLKVIPTNMYPPDAETFLPTSS